jgi:predicted DNA binding CopG/RHH family protein
LNENRYIPMGRRERREMSEIPSFESDAEAAQWFDTHDTAPQMDRLEQVQERIQIVRTRKRPPRKAVGLRLRVDHLEAIKQVAERKGIPYQTLIQMWLVEKLRQEAPGLLHD